MSTKPISDILANSIRNARQKSENCSPIKPRLKAGYSAPKSRGLLSDRQKKALVKLARDAWLIHGEPDGIQFDPWRKAACQEACGVAGLREARNHHYRALKSHFLALVGKDLQSLSLALSTGAENASENVEDAEQARWILRRDLAARGLSEAYAATIARQRFSRSSIDRLSAAQAMSILFEIRRLYVPVPEGSPSQRAEKGQRSQGGRRKSSGD